MLTPEEALDDALDNNPSIRAARLQVDAASARVLPSYLWKNPSFDVMWMNLPPASLDLRESEMRQYAVSQMIPFPGKMTNMGLEMAAERRGVEANADAEISHVLAQVERAYWMLYMLERESEILSESRALLDQLLASARSRYATGAAPQADLLRAPLARSELGVKLTTLEEEIKAARLELALLLGRDGTNLPQLPDDIPLSFDTLPLFYSDSAPQVRAANAMEDAFGHELRGAWLELAPDFMASYRWREMGGERGTGDVMVGVSIPLWVWPKGSGAIIAASAERKAARYETEAMRNEVESMRASLEAKIASSKARIRSIQDEVIPLAEQSLEASRIAYRTGAVDFPMLLDAEEEWRTVRMEFEEARFSYQAALADLNALLGGYEIEMESK